METVMNLEQRISEKVKDLSYDRQRQVLDFVEFLESKSQKVEFKRPDGTPMSALEAAGDLVGCLDSGLGDLSFNKKYLEGPKSK